MILAIARLALLTVGAVAIAGPWTLDPGLWTLDSGLVQAPQSQQPVFKAAADLVTIDVTVTTSGTPVGGLRATDFVLTDNGVPQTIDVVALEAVPATVTMIIDIGDFMSDTISSLVGDVRRIAAMVRPGDNVRLMAIDTYVRDLVPLRASAEWPQIETIATNGLASANDAIAAAIMRQHDPNRQHLIIAMTNGVDTGSVLDINVLTEIARRSSAPVHIVVADLFLEDVGPPKQYTTRRERLGRSQAGGLLGARERFWMPFHDRDFELQAAATQLTGGNWHMPDLFINRNASIIFRKFYDWYRRSYRLTYVPKGVARDGWHDVKVTTPGYSSYLLEARPGYAVATAREAIPSPPPSNLATIDGITQAYGRGDFPAATQSLRGAKDITALVDAFMEAGNPWPDRPEQEAAFVLELAHAVMASPQRNAAAAVRRLLDRHRRLVRDPIEAGPFERYWLWAATAMLQGAYEPAMTQWFVDEALKRFPAEPRLLLARAVLLDRRDPFGIVQRTAAPVRVPTTMPSIVGISITRVETQSGVAGPPGLTPNHIRDVSAAYDAAMDSPETAAEARIRKAWLLHRANRQPEALTLLQSAGADSSDGLLQYLRHLFTGRVFDALGQAGPAVEAYRAALALAPQAQSPRVALMAHALEAGDRAGTDQLVNAIQNAPASDWDPWWNYWQGDFRLFATAINRLRAQTR